MAIIYYRYLLFFETTIIGFLLKFYITFFVILFVIFIKFLSGFTFEVPKMFYGFSF